VLEFGITVLEQPVAPRISTVLRSGARANMPIIADEAATTADIPALVRVDGISINSRWAKPARGHPRMVAVARTTLQVMLGCSRSSIAITAAPSWRLREYRRSRWCGTLQRSLQRVPASTAPAALPLVRARRRGDGGAFARVAPHSRFTTDTSIIPEPLRGSVKPGMRVVVPAADVN
jgi:hypothetical protein